MASPTKNFLSLVSLLILVVGTFSTVMLVLSDNNVVKDLWGQDYYKIGSALSASLVVLILIYLTYTSSEKSTGYKFIIIAVLLIGLITEIIMTLVKMNYEYEEYAHYALIVFNFLYRAYYLIGYVQEPWAEMALQTVDGAVKNVTSPLSGTTEDPLKAFQDKWNDVRAQAKAKHPGDVIFVDADAIINKAKSNGEFTKSKLVEAAGALKVKSTGETVTQLNIPSMGGRRKVRR